ncbi:NAD(P)H-binding protein [Leifsonia sp. L25]|uniref:NAD(P)H-binding protein n=1 Tax=Actinomycetes TaxID=1760 RepID=UPI003D68E901
MSLTIFGASGRTGAELVREALDRGEDVTVVVRRPASFDPRVTVGVVPDFADTAALREALTRAGLAAAMLDSLGRPETERAAVGIAG